MITYTDAPPDYDGFGTTTVRTIGKTHRGPVRVVETPREHLDWQRTRYQSGSYLACDEGDIPHLVKIEYVTLDNEEDNQPQVAEWCELCNRSHVGDEHWD